MPCRERGAGERAEPGFEAGVVEVGRDRQLPVAVRDEPLRLGDALRRVRDERLDRHDRPRGR